MKRQAFFVSTASLVVAVAANLFSCVAVTSDPETSVPSEAFFRSLDLDAPELADVRKAVEERRWDAATEAFVSHVKTRKSPLFLFDRTQREKLVADYRSIYGVESFRGQIDWANRICEHDFGQLAGGAAHKLERDFSWLLGANEATNVLSRFDYWPPIGQAYWATGDEKYVREYLFLLRKWVRENPRPEKVDNTFGKNGNTWRTLETGIRCETWLMAYQYFMDSPLMTVEDHLAFWNSLREHAEFLYNYTTRYRQGNWQIVEASGLAMIGIYCPEFRASARWRSRAFDYLEQHMEKDILPDGTHSELTPNYHCWCAKKLMLVTRLAELNGVEPPGVIRRKHEKMFEAILKIVRPNGTSPSLGDTYPFSLLEFLNLGAKLYRRPDMLRKAEGALGGEYFWTLGGDVEIGAEPYNPLAPSTALPNAGYYVTRGGWGNDDLYLLFDCSPYAGPHSHADGLNIEIFGYGNPLIIDPGAISYDNPLHWNYYKKSRAHNVFMIDQKEQGRRNASMVDWFTGERFDLARGAFSNRAIDEDVAWKRTVVSVKGEYWFLIDRFEGEAKHVFQQFFHFAPVKIAKDEERKSVRTLFEKGGNILVQPFPADAALEERSEGLNKEPYIVYSSERSLPATFATLLYPYKTPNPPEVAISSIGVAGKVDGFVVERAGKGRDIFLSRTDGGKGIFGGTILCDGETLIARFDTAGVLESCLAANVSNIVLRARGKLVTLLSAESPLKYCELSFSPDGSIRLNAPLPLHVDLYNPDSKNVVINGRDARYEKRGDYAVIAEQEKKEW